MNQESAAKLEAFFADYPLRKFRKGQVLILNGDTPDKVHLLVSGHVKMYDVNYRGDEIILQIFQPPAYFPMSYALNGGTSPYIFEADTDIEVRLAPAAEVVKLLEQEPALALDLLRRLYRGTDVLLGRIAQLSSGSAKSRTGYELAIEAQRFGVTTDQVAYKLDITEKDLAARAGLSRETVSRELQKLKAEGYVAFQDRQFVVKDLPALQRWLHPGE